MILKWLAVLAATFGFFALPRKAQGAVAREIAPDPVSPLDSFQEADMEEREPDPVPTVAPPRAKPTRLTVPRILMPPNVGQNPQPPSERVFALFPDRISDFATRINQASTSLDVKLNSWFRTPGSVGEQKSQHLLALAVDVQGPDQERFAKNCANLGLYVVREGNDGKAYNHVHVQSERAGLLSRLGVVPSRDLA